MRCVGFLLHSVFVFPPALGGGRPQVCCGGNKPKGALYETQAHSGRFSDRSVGRSAGRRHRRFHSVQPWNQAGPGLCRGQRRFCLCDRRVPGRDRRPSRAVHLPRQNLSAGPPLRPNSSQKPPGIPIRIRPGHPPRQNGAWKSNDFQAPFFLRWITRQ